MSSMISMETPRDQPTFLVLKHPCFDWELGHVVRTYQLSIGTDLEFLKNFRFPCTCSVSKNTPSAGYGQRANILRVPFFSKTQFFWRGGGGEQFASAGHFLATWGQSNPSQ